MSSTEETALEAREIAEAIAHADSRDYFDWRFGGDGDNGEELVEAIIRALPAIRQALRTPAVQGEMIEKLVASWKLRAAPPHYTEADYYRAFGVEGCVEDLESLLHTPTESER